MLTNKEEDSLRKCLRWLNDNPESPVEDCMSAADVAGFLSELLTLREAVAPQMAEVDDCFQNYNGNYTREQMCAVPRLESIARTAILACEQQKQRADEAEKRCEKQIEITYEAKAVVSRMQKEKHDYDGFANQRFTEDKEKIDTLTAQLSSIRDAGGDEVERLFTETIEGIGVDGEYAGHDQLCRDSKVSAKRLRDIAISRGQKRDEVVGLLKWIRNRMYLDFEDFERDAENPEYSNSIRIREDE